jgi:site-specific recombinase XerD
MPACKTARTCRAALRGLLSMLGIARPSSTSIDGFGAVDAKVGRFDDYMAAVCGLSPATRLYRRRYAREFLTWRFHRKPPDPAILRAADLLRYLRLRAPAMRSGSASVMMTSLRCLIKFFEFGRQCPPGLSQALPKLPNWKGPASPEVLTNRECRALAASFDGRNAAGRRDAAILRLMLDLGLRCSEVAHLGLDDLDWRQGTIAIRHNKQRRDRLLPLPVSVGMAISLYLRTGRPKSASRRLFLCHRLPVGHPVSVERVRGAVRRALGRIGRERGGPHLLRHTFATVMHNRGVPLKEVADVLGHQSPDTTAVYARVNVGQLEKVALPWPGVRR